MKINDNNRWIEDTLQHIKDQIHHSYLHQSIGAPIIDEDRLSLLIFPFQINGSYTELDRSYVTSATLIQTALDTHELVSKEQKDLLRVRQLTVLAGDYYSGLYYRILAKIPDVALIRCIAHAIQEINEHKIELTLRSFSSKEDFIYSLMKIESAIITQLFKHQGFKQFITLAEDVLVLNRLVREKECYLKNEPAILFAFLNNELPLNASSQVREQQLWRSYQGLVDQKKEQIVHKLSKLSIPLETLSGSISSVLQSSSERPKIYAEEG
ncbi:heptaprenyl diphosphate synthase component 1 [Jeotgalibacillus marinus]|uniref:Heptaprenyl diphosphate synthase component 1 n=1 Tax=Jeotgalibacillus marinus TaxID=86667 RepID=A0ABV3PYV1_9BACL